MTPTPVSLTAVHTEVPPGHSKTDIYRYSQGDVSIHCVSILAVGSNVLNVGVYDGITKVLTFREGSSVFSIYRKGVAASHNVVWRARDVRTSST